MDSFRTRSRTTRQQCTLVVAALAVGVPMIHGGAGQAVAAAMTAETRTTVPEGAAPAEDSEPAPSVTEDPAAVEQSTEVPASEPAEQPGEQPAPEPGAASQSPTPEPAPAAAAQAAAPQVAAPQVAVTIDVAGIAPITVAPGQAVTESLINLTQSAGPAVPADSGSISVHIDGPATTSTARAPFAVSSGGSANLGGCSALGQSTLTCSDGNPFAMAAGSSAKYNHIRIPFVVSPDALPGDVITVTSTYSMHEGFENANPNPSTVLVATIPLTAATIASSGTVGTTPTITGSGVPGGTVDVSVAGRPVITADVDERGTWTVPVTDPLPAGPASIDAVQHRNGMTAAAATGSVVVDATAPDAPTVDTPGTWADGTGTLTGTAEPGSVVVVRDGAGNEVGRTTADPVTGAWSIPVTTPLPEGSSDLAVTAQDEYGNVSTPSTATVDVPDTIAPDAPVIDAPSAWTGGTGTLTGTAEPGSIVIVHDAAGNEIGRATADPVTGAWSIPVTAPLPEGDTALRVTATDAAGNTSAPTDTTVTVPDGTAPIAPVVDQPSQWADGTGTLTGTAEPGSVVVVRDGAGNEVGRTTADPATGSWSIPVTSPLPEGESTLTATATDAAGNLSPGTDVQVDVPDTTAPEAPSFGSGPIGTSDPVTGTAEPGSTVVIRDADGTVIGTGIAGEDGSWSITPDRALPVGDSLLTATATDAAGNVSSVTTGTISIEAPTTEPGTTDPGTSDPGATDPVTIAPVVPLTGTAATIITPVASAASDPTHHTDTDDARRLAYTGSEGAGILALGAAALAGLGVLLRLRRRRS